MALVAAALVAAGVVAAALVEAVEAVDAGAFAALVDGAFGAASTGGIAGGGGGVAPLGGSGTGGSASFLSAMASSLCGVIRPYNVRKARAQWARAFRSMKISS